MDFEEYILFAAGFDLENMSDEEQIKKAMANKKVNAMVQDCARMAAPYIK